MGKYDTDDNYRYLLENNLIGAKTIDELEEAEAFAFSLRAAELEQKKSRMRTFDLDSFKKLHRHLFQDIYPFAGEFRNVQLMKGRTRFCQVQFLQSASLQLFKELNLEPRWRGIEQAATRLAYFKTELNMLHHFREGNGRTIRIFICEYAFSRGVDWKYENMDRESYMQAMIQSVINQDCLQQIFLETILYKE